MSTVAFAVEKIANLFSSPLLPFLHNFASTWIDLRHVGHPQRFGHMLRGHEEIEVHELLER